VLPGDLEPRAGGAARSEQRDVPRRFPPPQAEHVRGVGPVQVGIDQPDNQPAGVQA
jgi:hypothetical protein